MRQTRYILVVTGSRADFGLLQPVMRAVAARDDLVLRTVLTGLHLVTDTWRDVTAAGIAVDAKVPMQEKGAVGRGADVAALGRGVTGFGELLATMKPTPDVVVVLGDRIEALAAALAASVGGVRVAHLHGGDRAEGVADEAMRHAISKLAHLHFPATAQSARRLLRMGEDERCVFEVGSPAIDALATVKPAADAPQAIVLMHPVGDPDATEHRRMGRVLDATASLHRLVLAPNHDPGAGGIRGAIIERGIEMVEHLPRQRFLELLAGAGMIVGNSSAGLIEAAALGVPCVNVGPRQAGRQKPRHVIDCDDDPAALSEALARAARAKNRAMKHPYGDGRTGPRVAKILATIDLADVSLRKCNAY
jgi:UDP-hydrolysing UDP-N-acetyl-D-glucosamine 2-epimerase